MSQIWEINGLSLELDIEDYDTSKNYKEAFDKMGEEEKKLKKDGNNEDFIKNYCLLFYHLFDNLFGEGAGEKIFNGKYNARICDEVYDSFLNFVRNQNVKAAERRADLINAYTPNRAARRAAKKIK